MIDFIKLNVSYLSESDLLKNLFFELKRKTNLSTGEMEYPITGKYYNMDIKVNPKKKEISGSIHKLRNEIKKGQNQNYDDFTFDDLHEMIYHIRDVFNLNLDKTIIENLECGLNINIHNRPETILRKHLIVWYDMEPSKNLSFDDKGKFILFEKSQYSIKLYDKGKQAGHSEHIMRIEYHSDKNEYFSKLGTRTLNHLLDRDKIQMLLNHLYELFCLSVIVDDTQTKIITGPRDKEIFIRGINPKTWLDFQSEPIENENEETRKKRKAKERKAKERFNKTLESIMDKYNLNTIRKEIETKLKEKGQYLLECHKMTDIEQTKDDTSECHTLTDIEVLPGKSCVWSQNTEMSQNDTYIYCQSVTSEKCIITGYDISHQTTNKKYLLESSIKEMKETEPEIFKKLEKEFKPQKKNLKIYDDVCKEIAHRIRRKYQTLRGKENIYKGSLFPLYLPKLENLKGCRGV